MTQEIQTRLLAIASKNPSKASDTAASFMRKVASPGDPVKKFTVLNGHLGKLTQNQRVKLLDLVDALEEAPGPAEGEVVGSVD